MLAQFTILRRPRSRTATPLHEVEEGLDDLDQVNALTAIQSTTLPGGVADPTEQILDLGRVIRA